MKPNVLKALLALTLTNFPLSLASPLAQPLAPRDSDGVANTPNGVAVRDNKVDDGAFSSTLPRAATEGPHTQLSDDEILDLARAALDNLMLQQRGNTVAAAAVLRRGENAVLTVASCVHNAVSPYPGLMAVVGQSPLRLGQLFISGGMLIFGGDLAEQAQRTAWVVLTLAITLNCSGICSGLGIACG